MEMKTLGTAEQSIESERLNFTHAHTHTHTHVHTASYQTLPNRTLYVAMIASHSYLPPKMGAITGDSKRNYV